MHHTTRSTPSDLQLLDLLDTLPDALFIVNDEQRIQYANAAAEKRTGTLVSRNAEQLACHVGDGRISGFNEEGQSSPLSTREYPLCTFS